MLSQPMRHGRLGADRVLQQQAHSLDLALELCNPNQKLTLQAPQANVLFACAVELSHAQRPI